LPVNIRAGAPGLVISACFHIANTLHPHSTNIRYSHHLRSRLYTLLCSQNFSRSSALTLLSLSECDIQIPAALNLLISTLRRFRIQLTPNASSTRVSGSLDSYSVYEYRIVCRSKFELVELDELRVHENRERRCQSCRH